MTAATVSASALPVKATGPRAPGWWGMVSLIATEGMLFACLFASYVFLFGSVEAFGAEGGRNPPLTLVIPMTVVLLASSVAMYWGERGIRQGDQTRLRIGMAISFVLGVTFLVLQSIEYSHRHAHPSTSAYDSLFYTITFIHGSHVFVGLLMGAVTQVRAWLGHFTSQRHLAVQNTALYWHFVDAVWIVVFALLYVSPRFWHQ